MAAAVVLDRIEPGVTPDYCTHGRAKCSWCKEWCWLGDKTGKMVEAGFYKPVCRQCADEYISPSKISGRVDDHKRADGPH